MNSISHYITQSGPRHFSLGIRTQTFQFPEVSPPEKHAENDKNWETRKFWKLMSKFPSNGNLGNLRNLLKPQKADEMGYLQLKQYHHTMYTAWNLIKMDYKTTPAIVNQIWHRRRISDVKLTLHWTSWNINICSTGRDHRLVGLEVLVYFFVSDGAKTRGKQLSIQWNWPYPWPVRNTTWAAFGHVPSHCSWLSNEHVVIGISLTLSPLAWRLYTALIVGLSPSSAVLLSPQSHYFLATCRYPSCLI